MSEKLKGGLFLVPGADLLDALAAAVLDDRTQYAHLFARALAVVVAKTTDKPLANDGPQTPLFCSEEPCDNKITRDPLPGAVIIAVAPDMSAPNGAEGVCLVGAMCAACAAKPLLRERALAAMQKHNQYKFIPVGGALAATH